MFWIVRTAQGKPRPQDKAVNLWKAMYTVWQLLTGPVVNPTLAREAMIKTADEGAVWDNSTWSLIDRVISHDAAVWLVSPTEGTDQFAFAVARDEH